MEARMSIDTTSRKEPEPLEQLFQICLGFIPAICLNVVAKLAVADFLANGPQSVADLARATNCNEDALGRIMRAVSAFGVFKELDAKRFEQTPASDLLRSDHPKSLRPFVSFFPDPLHFRFYSNLMHSARTGETTGNITVGMELFDYLKGHPEDSEIFNAAMVNMTQMFVPAVIDAYDFSETQTLVDVGGGHGSVLASVLQKFPKMQGILFDIDHVVAGAHSYLKSTGVADRCRTIAGDMFLSVPEGGDTYIMKNIIHDWDDERSITILRNVRAALGKRDRGKVLLLEMLIGPGCNPLGYLADIEMMVLPGGRERSEQEYRELFAQAGFRLTRVVPTQSLQSVIEAVPA
jgi:hypothetical protein